MIKEFEYYHGAVILGLIQGLGNDLIIKPYPSNSNSSYIIYDNIGLYIKHSTKRMAPWQFTFLREHQDEILEMKSKLTEVFVLLVCNDDGIVCIDHTSLKKLLDEIHDDAEWIRVTKKAGGMYNVNGKNGSLEYKVGRNAFPKKIIEFILNPDKSKRA
jgi:hypothetical protein